MIISECTVKNFKSLDNNIKFNVPDGTLGSGLNIFVGENNSGKSTFFEALYFLRKNTDKEVGTIKKFGSDDQEHHVELVLSGDDLDWVADNFVTNEKHRDGIKGAIFEEDGKKFLKVKRSFQDEKGSKDILFFKDNKFQNITGIPASFQSFFQTSHIWADTSPEKEAAFGSSTICGNLLADISEKFKLEHADQLQKFKAEFDKTFNDKDSGLQGELDKVASETEEVLKTQFGNSKLSFKFEEPKIDFIFKNIKILVNDGEETDISEKGHGLQRAVILALLQVYSRRLSKIENEGSVILKPHFLFIDEPELGLHPQAQKRLFEALKEISKTHQVFITTHSENFISPDLISNVFKFKRSESGIKIFSDANKELKLIEGGNFFLHHHKLFFASKAIFVEGIEDVRRYTKYCLGIAEYKDLPSHFSFMSGCGNAELFEKFADIYGIAKKVIVDVDFCSSDFSTKYSLAGAPGKQWYLDHREDAEFKEVFEGQKNSLSKRGILLLSRPDVMSYLNETGQVDGESIDQKNQELVAAFDSCLALG